MSENYVTLSEFEEYKKMINEKMTNEKMTVETVKGKKIKTENVPNTKPPTAYQLFVKENYHKIQAENPDFKFRDITRQISKMWALQKTSNEVTN
jgi:hypothetical protein